MPIYIAVLPDGSEFADEWTKGTAPISDRSQSQCDEAVRKAGLTTKRKSPQRVEVKLFRLEAKDGNVHRIPVGSYDVMPFCEPLTGPEYEEELMEMTKFIPDEFLPFIRNFACEHCAESNYDSMATLAQQIVDGLKPCINEFMRGK